MVTPNLLAAFRLKDLIETGELDSRLPKRTSRDVSHGYQVVFASCIEPIGRGLMALGAVGTNLLVDISHNVTKIHGNFQRDVFRYKFVFFNVDGPGCACTQPSENAIFGTCGSLSLQAVTLEVGQGYDRRPRAEVGLVLPAWASERRRPDAGEFVIAKIDSSGHNDATRYLPFVRTAAGTESYANLAGSLKHITGITSRDDLEFKTTGCASIDMAVGFPGAEDYIAAHLPKLGKYLEALAASLAGQHRH